MITSGQVTANNTAQSLCVVPPGPCLVILSSDPASAATAYYGAAATGGTLTSSNGVPLGAGVQSSIAGYPTSHGGTLSVVTAGTLSATVGWLISRG